MPETRGCPVEKQSKAFHSTEQMRNNHVKVKIRDNFSPQHIIFLKISTGFFVLWAALYCNVCFPALISAWSFLEGRGWFLYWQAAKWMQMFWTLTFHELFRAPAYTERSWMRLLFGFRYKTLQRNSKTELRHDKKHSPGKCNPILP